MMIDEELNINSNHQLNEPISKAVMIKRTTRFAHDCVNLAMLFRNDKLGYHIQNQLIRCSTSVAANYRAANLAQSKASFVAKLSIVIEEADESSFWLEFGQLQGVINSDETTRLIKEANELALIFISSRKSIQTTLNTSK